MDMRSSMRGAVARLAILLVMLVSGCSSNRNPAEPGTVNFLIESMPTNLDPRIGTDAHSAHLDGLIFSSLVAHDAQMNIIPDLAETLGDARPAHVCVPFATRREISRRARSYLRRCEIHVRLDPDRRGEDREARSIPHGRLD